MNRRTLFGLLPLPLLRVNPTPVVEPYKKEMDLERLHLINDFVSSGMWCKGWKPVEIFYFRRHPEKAPLDRPWILR